ncbi:hypothetical protein GCM10028818_60010 [Spirosoma horti]
MQTTVQNELSFIQRLTAPNSGIFKLIQKIGVVLGILGAAILAAEQKGIEIPGLVSFIGNQAAFISGIIASAIGATAIGVSQLSVDFEAYAKEHELDNV